MMRRPSFFRIIWGLASILRVSSFSFVGHGAIGCHSGRQLRQVKCDARRRALPSLSILHVSEPTFDNNASVSGSDAHQERQRKSSTDEIQSDQSDADSFNWERQWYPIAPLSQIEDAADGRNGGDKVSSLPQACTILGKKLVVWKSNDDDDGGGNGGTSAWSVLDDTCPHRKTALSTGKIVRGIDSCAKRLACRMHGWQFDSDGTCAGIPMMERNMTDSDRSALRTVSYPTRTEGGLLWVFMDPTVPLDALPDIPDGATAKSSKNDHWLRKDEENNDDVLWVDIYYLFPVSYESMVENSFDPSHANFVHERRRRRTKSGSSPSFGQHFSPENATPMRRFDVVSDVDARSGFVVQHTPYQRSEERDDDDAVTTRRFVPPCTQITNLPGKGGGTEIRIQFVPQTKRETRVIFSSAVPKPKNPVLKRLFTAAFDNDLVHTMLELSESRRRFNDQDRIVMQAQDERKMIDGLPWADLKPSKSDVGVATFQRWMAEFGGGGPFANAKPTPNAGALSMWESHGQHCSRCKRALKRFVAIERRASKVSNASLILAALAAASSLLTTKVRASALVLLVASYVARCVAAWAADVQGNMLAFNLPKRQIQDVYVN